MSGKTPGPWILAQVNRIIKSGLVEMHLETLLLQRAELLAQNAELLAALRGLLNVIAVDDLVPETVSYMRQARAAIASATQGSAP